MRKFKISIKYFVLFGLIILILTLFAEPLINCICNKRYRIDGNISAPPYESVYTPEEHREKITERTKIKYEYRISKGELLEFEVYTVYGFDEVPEYFLVELLFKSNDMIEDDTTDSVYYSHVLGRISEEKYYIIDTIYPYSGEGASIWRIENVLDYKLYYGSSCLAYKNSEGKILGWYLLRYTGEGIPEYTDAGEITEDEFESLLKGRNTIADKVY